MRSSFVRESLWRAPSGAREIGMQQQQEGETPPAPGTGLDEEKLAKLVADISNTVFTARSKKLRTEISDDFTKGLTGLTEKFEAAIAAIPKGGKKNKDPAGNEPPEPTGDITASPEYRGLMRRLEEQKAATDKLTQQLAEAENEKKRTTLRARLAEELGKNGVTDARCIKGACTELISDGRVAYDDDGRIVYVESENSSLDLATGIKAYAKTPEAKVWLPPTGARGSGDRGGGNPPPPKGGPPPQEVTSHDHGMALVGFARDNPNAAAGG